MSYNDVEFNYAIQITGSNTTIVLGTLNSEAQARESFRRLTFESAN